MRHWSLGMNWMNPPAASDLLEGGLKAETQSKGDFWRNTFYGYCHDDGHFLHAPLNGDFSASITFSAHYNQLYDQAGIMVRRDAEHWIKAGTEFANGVVNLSVVVTNGNSDWSCITIAEPFERATIRASRYGEAVRIDYCLDGGTWALARLAWLVPSESLDVGPMFCAPLGGSFGVVFERYEAGPPVSRELYA